MPTLGMPETDALLRIAFAAAEEGDFERARACYERGAELGDGMCFQALGYMYDVGEGAAVDKVMALKLYRAAWRRGDHAAALNIAIIYRERGQMRRMFQWFERVACAGDGSAQLEMAKCYLNGIGVRKDVPAAIRCLATARTSDYIAEHERDEVETLLSALRQKLSE